MFKINNEKIGAYVSELIESKFDSARRFCKEYLEVTRGEEANEDEIQNMANRLSQIKKGKNAIQIHDLPIFSELLDISFEQILSAGEYIGPRNSRMTNYGIAQSHNKKEWKLYIEREDTPILNPDEYGKNVLDYAIEFNNYDFLKFLLDENYIWFDSRKDNDYVMTFGAGTSITRVKDSRLVNLEYGLPWPGDGLEIKLAAEDQLRMHIISLAADHKDLGTLEKLRAREIPELYYRAHYWGGLHPDIDAHYDKVMVSHIAKSSDKVLDYFTDSFGIRDYIKYKDGSKRKHTFIFPYISQLLDMLIINNSPFLETALEKSISYNEETLKKLKALIGSVIESGDWRSWYDGWKQDIHFYENGNIISFRGPRAGIGMITNVICTTKESKVDRINRLIEKLNESYDRIRNISEESFV